MSISWDDLRILEAFGRLGSAGKAARELGVAVATVYRRIAALEEAVGVACIHRGSRGETAKLSDAGRRLASVGQSTREALAEANRLNALGDDRLAGTIGLTTVEGFVPLLDAPLAELAGKHPEMTVEVHIGDRGPSVRKRAVEVSISVMHHPPEVLWGRKLFDIDYGVFGTAQAIQREPLRWVTLRAEDASALGQWEAAQAGVVAARTNSRALAMSLAQGGTGVIVLPRLLGQRCSEMVELERYRKSLESLRIPAWILTHPDIRQHPRVVALMTALVGALVGET